jgi:hypothetical protein
VSLGRHERKGIRERTAILSSDPLEQIPGRGAEGRLLIDDGEDWPERARRRGASEAKRVAKHFPRPQRDQQAHARVDPLPEGVGNGVGEGVRQPGRRRHQDNVDGAGGGAAIERGLARRAFRLLRRQARAGIGHFSSGGGFRTGRVRD